LPPEDLTAFKIHLFDFLLNNFPDRIYFKDTASRFILVSRAKAEYSGLSDAAEMEGKTDFDFFAPERAEPAFKDEQEIMRTGKAVIAKDEKATTPDGEVNWVITTKMPLRDANGGIIGTCGISRDITERKNAEAELQRLNRQLIDVSRQAGMAEVATNVLHNVGNVLNSVNISQSVISKKIHESAIDKVTKLANLLEEHANDLGAFLTADATGQKVPKFLIKLAKRLTEEKEAILAELELLGKNVEHIKEIVAVQQSYAHAGGVHELVPIADLVENALQINETALARHRVEIIREFGEVPPVLLEKHKVMQVMVNLISNAKDALIANGCIERRLVLGTACADGRIFVRVNDNGIGISPENMDRIFAHGFTTKKDGHGFGLHSAALTAKEMGGSLQVESKGHGQGATFTLTLPLSRADDKRNPGATL
jgi:PAS domain S-box-containing protein